MGKQNGSRLGATHRCCLWYAGEDAFSAVEKKICDVIPSVNL